MDIKIVLFKISMAVILLFCISSIMDDIYPKSYVVQDQKDGDLVLPNSSQVGDAECRSLEIERICYVVWDVRGYNTGLPLVILRYNTNPDGSIPEGFRSDWELVEYIFWRESDLVSGESWDEDSRIDLNSSLDKDFFGNFSINESKRFRDEKIYSSY